MADKVLTWREKLKQGLPLNTLEQVQADATRITERRMRDQEEDAKREQERYNERLGIVAEPEVEVPVDSTQKKGK